MTDKPDAADAEFFALPGHRVLALQGRDAPAFAQAQAMSDVAALSDGRWQWSGWLTPKGRVIALFALLRLDAQTIWLLLPDADADAIAGRLQGFVFRSKVAVTARPDLRVSGRFALPGAARGACIAGDAASGIELDMSGAGGARALRIGPVPAMAGDADAVERWRIADLRHGLPRLAPAQSEHWTPQQLSLDRLAAFSVRKGCYPGQEIVARTHFLGQAKRALRLFESDGRASDDGEVHDADGHAGTIASVAGRWLAAVLPSGGEGAARAGDATLAPRPFLDGLARLP